MCVCRPLHQMKLTQKRVLDIHEKARNYDACKMVNSSIVRIKEFKKEFENWFLNNGVEFEF